MRRARTTFDAAYYQRFYRDPATRSVTPREVARQVQFLGAYLHYLRVPVRRILDIGCGLGLMRAPLERVWPRARYTGVEISEHLCARMGWDAGSVVDWQARSPYDLVLCHDVIQYLADDDASRAIENLSTLTRSALFLGVITTEDWEQNCDRARTDDRVWLRDARWYRTRLKRHFDNLGGGLLLKRDAPQVRWALERAE